MADVRIPWDAVETVRARRRSVPSRRTVHVEPGDGGSAVSVAVLKQTRIDVVLRGRTPVRLPDGVTEVTEVRLYADDPRAFVASVNAAMPGRRAAA